MPKAGTFFKNFNLEEPQLYDLMGKISDSGEEAGAQQFYDANKAMIVAWFN
jgi:glycine betaine/proline transport system substrate-binding protein